MAFNISSKKITLELAAYKCIQVLFSKNFSNLPKNQRSLKFFEEIIKTTSF